MKKNLRDVLKKSLVASLSLAMVFSTVLSHMPTNVKAANRTEKIANNEIAEAEAKSYGPSGDGDSIWASFDGDTSTYTNSNYGDPANCKPQVYTITLKETVKLNKVRIHPRNSGGNVGNGAPDVCTVSVSTDGSSYTNVVTDAAVTDTALTWTDIAFTAVSAKYVKLTINSKHEAVVATGEVELYKEVSDEPALDKSTLTKAITDAEALKETDYTADSWAGLKAALATAKTVSGNATAQADIDAAATALQAAIKALVSADVDAKTALQTAYDKAKTEKKADYSVDAYRALGTTGGLTGCAKVVLDNYNAVPAEIAVVLTDALNELMAGKPEQSITKYKEQISELKALVEKYYVKGDFKPGVDANVDTYLGKAETVLANSGATTSDCSWRVYELSNQLRSMYSAGGKLSADGKEIYQLVQEQRADDPALYKPGTWDAYVKACEDGWTYINSNKTAAEIAAKKEAILAAKEALIKNDVKLIELRQLAAEKSKITNDGYTRESWRALKNAIWQIEQFKLANIDTVTEEEYQTLKSNLENASAGLVKGGEGTETGNVHLLWSTSENKYLDVWAKKEADYRIKGGQLYVSNEVVNGDGTTTLTVTWINDGRDPETGGLMHNVGIFNKPEWEERSFETRDWQEVSWLKVIATKDDKAEYLYFDSSAGAAGVDIGECNGFTEEERAGFTKEITVKTGSSVVLELSGWNTPASAYSLGVYQTKEMVPIDRSELEEAIENAKELNSAEYTDASWADMKDALAKAEEVFADENATQDEIDKAAEDLNKAVEALVKDVTAPKVELSIDSDTGKVTLKANEAIQDVEGWERVDECTLTKVFDKEGKYSVTVKDLAGNETKVDFEIIIEGEPDNPGETDKPNKPGETDKPNKPGTKPADKKPDAAVKTGDSAPIMLWTVMGIMAVIAAAVAAMKKKRIG